MLEVKAQVLKSESSSTLLESVKTTAMEGNGFYNKVGIMRFWRGRQGLFATFIGHSLDDSLSVKKLTNAILSLVQHSSLQAKWASAGTRIRDDALAALPVDKIQGQSVTIADFASSQGHNSLVPMGAAVDSLLERGAGSVTAVHVDLPGNDWNTLIPLMASNKSYIANRSDKVFSYACGRDMRLRNFPDSSVIFGWGSTAQHWLSEAPAITGTLCHTTVPRSEQLVRLARKDWNKYLQARRKELVVGGQLVHVEMLRNPDGTMGGEDVWNKTYELMQHVFGAKEVEGCVIPFYFRDRNEFLEPFCDPGLGLAVADHDIIEGIPDAVTAKYKQDGDAEACAEGFVGMMKAAAFPSLELEKRFGKEKTDEFLRLLKEQAKKDPLGYQSTHSIIAMRITRIH